jgi:hypothetical protein
MDEIGKELAKSGIKEAWEVAKDFLAKLAGPAAEEVGFLLQDQVRFYRFKNQLRILAKAQKMLHDAKIKPSQVPLRTLVPILEGASLEDDDYLSTKWAGLLASAASGESPLFYHPSYAKILAQLSPNDAKYLDQLAQYAELKNDEVHMKQSDYQSFKQSMIKTLGLSAQEAPRIWQNLFRLGLCYMTKKSGKQLLKMSDFGFHFVQVCSGPSKATQ